MAVTSVYSEPLRRRYVAQRCSHACLFQTVITIALIVAPFFVALSTGSFWAKRTWSHGRALVEPTALAYASFTTSTGAGVDLTSDPTYARALSSPATGSVSAYPVYEPGFAEESAGDSSQGSAADERVGAGDVPRPVGVRVRGKMPTGGEGVVAARIAVVVRASRLGKFAEVAQAVAFVAADSAVPSSRLFVDGELRTLTPARTAGSVRADATSPVNATVARTAGTMAFFEDLVTSARARDTRVEIDRAVTLWTPGAPASQFEFEIYLRIPEEDYVYIPGFWETVKFAWVQYLAVFFIFWFAAHHLRHYVFRYQVVETTVMADVAPKIKPF